MKSSVFWLAVLSRVIVIALQFVSNQLIPDHDAGVFLSPQSEQSKANPNPFDKVIEVSLGGFRRWDAQYFLHIAEYGYTYENVLAFFPLFPLCVRILGQALLLVLPFFSLRALLLLSAVLLNVLFFGKAAQTLYDLSWLIFRSRTRAKFAALLFCINPGSVFFSAPYSESLYCWLTFAFFRDCLQGISVQQTFPLSLSIVCRSNGLINVVFLAYLSLQRFLRRFTVTTLLNVVFKSAVIIFFVLFHFGLLNAYHFYLFCHHLHIKFPDHIRHYAEQQGYVLAGNRTSEEVSPWCSNDIPMAYAYVQEHYWDVGFLRYFEYRQLPNFLLAAPCIVTILWHFVAYIRRNWRYSLRLGLFVSDAILSPVTQFDQKSFVFLVHAAALTIFCTLCIHVQVTTRMLASSSPVLYWLAADSFRFPKSVQQQPGRRADGKNKEGEGKEEQVKALHQTPKIYSLDEETDVVDTAYLTSIVCSKINRRGQLYLAWFATYSIVGTVLFCNFLPWT